MVDSAHNRGERLGNAGASPGRSRRCEGRRSRAETPLASGLGRRHGRAPRVRRPAVRRNSNPSRKGGFGDTQVLCRRSGGTRAGSVGCRRSCARSRRRCEDNDLGADRAARQRAGERTRRPRVGVRNRRVLLPRPAHVLRAVRRSDRAQRGRRHIGLGLQGGRQVAAGRRRRGDPEGRRHGALVLRPVRRNGRAEDARARARRQGCYRVLQEDDNGARTAAVGAVLHVGRTRVVQTQGSTQAAVGCPGKHRGLVRATLAGTVRSNALT